MFFSRERVIPLPEDTPVQKISRALHEPEGMADLALAVMWLVASTIVIFVPVLNASPVSYLFFLPVLLFISGYSILAALFPKSDDIGFAERSALSFGLSIVLSPLIGFVEDFTLGVIQMDLIVLVLLIISGLMILVAFLRRAILPPEQRFGISFSRIRDAICKGLFHPESDRIDRLLSVILVLVIIVAISTTIYVIASPKESEHFSEFYILGEKHMADDYPNQIVTGLSYPMFIGVGNHEYRNMTYTIETWATQTEFDNITNSTTILAMDPLERSSVVLSHNETLEIPYNLSVNKAGYNRVEFLLFNETVPGPDVQGSYRINASYRDLYLRIAVGDG
jgi:uncharacterized membrane protein